MSLWLAALMGAMVGAVFGFMGCALLSVGKITDLQNKLIDRGIDPD